jgi:RND family efflux transporter MFP subunit
VRFFRRLIIVAVILAAVGGGAFYAYTRVQVDRDKKPNIRQMTVDRGDLTLAVNATGTVAAQKVAKLSFEAPGTVQDVFVREGQRVIAGQILARQDDTAYQLGVKQAEAGLLVAQLTLEQVMAPPNAQDVAVAEANLKAAKDGYTALLSSVDPATINAAQLKYQQAQQAYADAQQRTRDAGGRYKLDSPQYQLALAQEGAASFGVEAARLQLEYARRGPDSRLLAAAKERITLAQAELSRVKAGPQQIQIDQAQLRVDQAKAALDQARQQRLTAELRAPFAGEVTTLNLKTGALAINNPNLPGVIITDRSALRVMINVDEIDIGQVREGQPVSLTLDALPGEQFSGVVAQIAPSANLSAGTVVTYQVRVDLPPTASRIKPGMTASVSIIVRQLNGVLRVPNIFIRLDRRTDQAFVNLVGPDGKLTEVPINIGLRTEEYSEVLGGLNEGDAVGINLDSTIKLFGQ